MTITRTSRRSILCGVFAATLLSTGAVVPALGADGTAMIPDFSSNNVGWAANGGDFVPIAGEKFKPVGPSAEHPYCGNNPQPACGNTVGPRIADTTNPILQPWAAKQMAEYNQQVLSGKEGFNAMSRCWPTGIPGLMLFTASPTYYLQSPKETTIIWSRGTNVRHVYMNVPHTKNPKPSWYGEAVGHYEGQELVIDTIGSNDKSFIDFYRTPHTTKIHTVERYRLGTSTEITDYGNSGVAPRVPSPILIGKVTVEDPGAFTAPWSAVKYYNARNTAIADSEDICVEGENNETNFFSQDSIPVPQNKTPDF